MSATISPIKDQTIVYGLCTWWDSIDKTDANGGLPLCPHCGSPLFEVVDEEAWWRGVDRRETEGDPGHRAFVEWLRGKCFRNRSDARASYEEAS